MFVKEIKLGDRHLIEDNLQGIYSWHLKPRRLTPDKVSKIYDAFNRFEICLSGTSIFNKSSKFSDNFIGKINRELENKSLESKFSKIDQKFLILFFQNNSLPIYIGRSKNIKGRLESHYAKYLEAISANFLNSMTEDFDFDSEEESGYFGLRLANLNKERWFNENELFIRYYNKSDLNYDEIKDLEYYLNRLYKPILGII
jgi:hypothetical protein